MSDTATKTLVARYRALPGVIPSPSDWGRIGGLARQFGVETVTVILERVGERIGRTRDPLRYLAATVRAVAACHELDPAVPYLRAAYAYNAGQDPEAAKRRASAEQRFAAWVLQRPVRTAHA